MTKHFQSSNKDNGFEANLIEVANYLYSHKLFIAIAAIATSAIVGTWSFWFSSPTYSASSTVIYSHKATNPLDAETGAYWARKSEVENKLYVLSVFIDSDRFQKALAAEVLSEDDYSHDTELVRAGKKIIRRSLERDGITDETSAALYLAQFLDVTIDSEKQSIRLASHTGSPALSQAIANVGSATLVKINYEIVLKELNSVVEFIEGQVQKTREHLFSLEEDLSLFQKNEKILNVNDTGTQLDNIQFKSALAMNDLRVQRASAEIWITEIEKTIEEFKTNLQSGMDSPLYLMQLQSKLDVLLYQRTVSKNDRSIASLDSGEVSTAFNTTLEEFQRSLQNLQSSRVTMDPWKYLATLEESMGKARQKHTEIMAQLSAMEQISNSELEKYNTLPTVFRKINQVRREIQQTSDLYQQLNNKLQETRIKRAGMSNSLEVLRFSQGLGRLVDMAIWKKFIFSFIAGAFTLLLLLTLRYILIPTIRSRTDLQNAGAEVIAEIPYVRLSDKDTHINASAPLLLKWNQTSDEANSIRQARFNIEEKFKLQESRIDGKAKVLTVCSANSREGKTFVASNLAHSLAVAQFRVLLIDLDILNPSVRYYFNVKKRDTAAEAGQLIDDNIYFERIPVNAFMDIVDVPKTDTNLSDLLETPLLGDYLNSMKTEYDVIIIDTPPIRNSLEALISSRYSDGMIFVANQRGSLRHDVFKSIGTLKETYPRHIFAVLNFSYDELHTSRRRVAS